MPSRRACLARTRAPRATPAIARFGSIPRFLEFVNI